MNDNNPKYIEGVGWRSDVIPSMKRRLKGWDYCQPWIYMITMVVRGSSPLLGRLMWELDVKNAEDSTPTASNSPTSSNTSSPPAATPTASGTPAPDTNIGVRSLAILSSTILNYSHQSTRTEARERLASLFSYYPYVDYTPLGTAIARCIEEMPAFTPEIEVLGKVIMPVIQSF